MPGADIKVPWELSQMRHLMALAYAYRLTGLKKYLDEFQQQVFNWIESNPYGWGVNWASPMEVSVRACNIYAAWYIFRKSLPEEFSLKVLKSLYLHGKHIKNNLEKGRFW